jgi:hypothetical protein
MISIFSCARNVSLCAGTLFPLRQLSGTQTSRGKSEERKHYMIGILCADEQKDDPDRISCDSGCLCAGVTEILNFHV